MSERNTNAASQESPTRISGTSSARGGMVLDNNRACYSNVTPYTCRICGKREEDNYFGNRRMVDEKLCFACNFWDGYVHVKDNPNHAVIEGCHYVVCDSDSSNPRWNGFGGQVFKIKWSDGREKETNNLWAQGSIPEYFQRELVDNAQFVRKEPDSIFLSTTREVKPGSGIGTDAVLVAPPSKETKSFPVSQTTQE